MSRHDEDALALLRREPILHRLPRGASRTAIEAMTSEDFWEVDADALVVLTGATRFLRRGQRSR